MMNKIKKLILLTVACLALAQLSACNTVDGLGRDIEGAGRKIQTL